MKMTDFLRFQRMKRLTAFIAVVAIAIVVIATTAKTAPSARTLGEMPIGAVVSFEIGGAPVDFIVVHQGSPSDLYSGFDGGTVLLMKNALPNRRWHSSAVNDYANSDIHEWLNNEFLNMIDGDFRNLIRQTAIPCGNGVLQCRAFLLSTREVGVPVNAPWTPNEGDVFSYFAGLETTNATPRRVTTSAWWLRSPQTFGMNTTDVWLIGVNGVLNNAAASGLRGIRPALVLPNGIFADDDGRLTLTPTSSDTTDGSPDTTDETTADISTDDEDCCTQPETLTQIHDLLLIGFTMAVIIGIVCFGYKILSWYW
jgi:hypothetical protein